MPYCNKDKILPNDPITNLIGFLKEDPQVTKDLEEPLSTRHSPIYWTERLSKNLAKG